MMMNERRKNIFDGLIVLFAVLVIINVSIFIFVGCTPVKGFAHLKDSAIGIDSTTARQAAAVAQAEADALNAIAENNDAATARFIGAIQEATGGMETGIIGAALGGLATLWIPPPGARRKKEQE